MSERLRVLVVSHGHPAMSLGGAEIASHSLHKGLNTLPGVEVDISRPRRPSGPAPRRVSTHESASCRGRSALPCG